MSLRVQKAIKPAAGEEGIEEPGDDWSTRIVKLIPAEALGLYGTAVGLVTSLAPADQRVSIWLIAAVCILVIVMVRLRATRDPSQGQGPQVKAIAISLISFLIWLAALAATGASISPFPVGTPHIAIAPLLALLWGTVVPYFYRGD